MKEIYAAALPRWISGAPGGRGGNVLTVEPPSSGTAERNRSKAKVIKVGTVNLENLCHFLKKTSAQLNVFRERERERERVENFQNSNRFG